MPDSGLAGDVRRHALPRLSPILTADEPSTRAVKTAVQRFYETRRYRAAWCRDLGPNAQAYHLVQTLASLEREGLDPDHYDHAWLESRLRALHDRPGTRRECATLDVRLTCSFFLAAHHLLYGRVPLDSLDSDWWRAKSNTDLVALLQWGLKEDRLRDALDGLAPHDRGYARLRDAYATYHKLLTQEGWSATVPDRDLELGATGTAVDSLAEQLLRTGDLRNPPREGRFDRRLQSALRAYQRRNGLEESGKLDRATRATLSVPLARRVEQLGLNLERRRWLPRDLGAGYLAINVPDFSLAIVERGAVRETMRVVVGSPEWATPIFSDQLAWLEVNPTWVVPANILRYEIVPEYARDTLYFRRHELRVEPQNTRDTTQVMPASVNWRELTQPTFPYRVRQLAGANNPLGRIKFLCPNEYMVYLHDTPMKGHFKRRVRALSHGCVRVERPVDLARYLIDAFAPAAKDSLDAWLATTRWVPVRLEQTLPVHFLYWTAWVDDRGVLQFRDDIYGVDERLRAALPKHPAAFRLNVWSHPDSLGL